MAPDQDTWRKLLPAALRFVGSLPRAWPKRCFRPRQGRPTSTAWSKPCTRPSWAQAEPAPGRPDAASPWPGHDPQRAGERLQEPGHGRGHPGHPARGGRQPGAPPCRVRGRVAARWRAPGGAAGIGLAAILRAYEAARDGAAVANPELDALLREPCRAAHCVGGAAGCPSGPSNGRGPGQPLPGRHRASGHGGLQLADWAGRGWLHARPLVSRRQGSLEGPRLS